MEPKRLDEILKDIYKFDPQLSQKEEELKRLIQDLMDLIPDTDFSEEFSINLRDRIIQTIQQKKLARISKTNNISFILRYFVGGIAFASICIFSALYIFHDSLNPDNTPNNKPNNNTTQSKPNDIAFSQTKNTQTSGKDEKIVLDQTGQIIDKPTANQVLDTPIKGTKKIPAKQPQNIEQNQTQKPTKIIRESAPLKLDGNTQKTKNIIAFNTHITNTKDNAFGKISQEATQNNSFGGGEKMSMMQDMAISASPTAGESTSMSKAMPNFEVSTNTISYKYKYEGKALQIPQKLNVYKKIYGFFSINDAAPAIGAFDIKGINLNNFTGSHVSNLSFAQDTEFGYQINVDFMLGNINISQNYEKRPTYDYSQNKLKISDIPSDSKILQIADNFLEKYSIDTSSYAQPIINNDWKKEYEKSKQDYLLPETINVSYPIKIDGYTVLSDFDNPGLTLNISTRDQKVTSAGPISKNEFLASKYDTLDFAQVISGAQNGGYLADTDNPNLNIVTLKLDSPSIAYIKVSKYAGSQNVEFYVPVYNFKVKANPNYPDAPNHIIMPLIKNF